MNLSEEIKSYFITLKQLRERFYKNYRNSVEFYDKLFNPPVELVFYWNTEDYSGHTFSVYKYLGNLGSGPSKFIYIEGEFGSCEMCDNLPYSQEDLDRVYENIRICDTVQEIDLAYNKLDVKYLNPDLVNKFLFFKQKITTTSIQEHEESLNN
jgi:hypothetical protein